jgi:hypothetical protein
MQPQLRVDERDRVHARRAHDLAQAERRLAEARAQQATVRAHRVEVPEDGLPRYAGRQYKNVRLARERMESDRQRWEMEVERRRQEVDEKRSELEHIELDDSALVYPPLVLSVGETGHLSRLRVVRLLDDGTVLCQSPDHPVDLFHLVGSENEGLSEGSSISGNGKLFEVTGRDEQAGANGIPRPAWVIRQHVPGDWLIPVDD